MFLEPTAFQVCQLLISYQAERNALLQQNMGHYVLKSTREALENQAHHRHTKMSVTDGSSVIRRLIDGHLHLTISKTASGIGISYTNSQTTITGDLGYQKV